MKIGAITKNTIKRDKERQTRPCHILLRGEHNHDIQSAEALQQLRVLPETKEKFFKYFEAGMYMERLL